MPSIKIRSIFLSLACCCVSAIAQPVAAETPICGPAERAALSSIAERAIGELRGFLFAKKQLDQLAQYLESKEGSVKWAEATPASQLKLIQAAARSATISSAAVTRLPLLASTRYAFEGQFPFECSKSSELLAQMREPGFLRYLEVREQIATAAVAWYASGLFSKLTRDAAAPNLQPFLIPNADVPRTAKAGTSRQKSAAAKPTPAERQTNLTNRITAVDLLFRGVGAFNVGMTAIERDLLVNGALATAPAALLKDTLEVLADPRVKALLLDPGYLAFNLAVMLTAHKAEPLLIQDYPHLEPLGRNVSQAWAADFLRALPKPPTPEPNPEPTAPAPAVAPKR